MKKENSLKTSTHIQKESNMMEKREKRKEKVNEKKDAQGKKKGVALEARVLVFIPRARNSSRKPRAYMDVPGK